MLTGPTVVVRRRPRATSRSILQNYFSRALRVAIRPRERRETASAPLMEGARGGET